jgi:hypothetical protein
MCYSHVVKGTQELIRAIDARKIERAKKASMEEKMLDGPSLFRLSCQAIKAGLRLDHPEADEEKLHQLLIKRVYRNEVR